MKIFLSIILVLSLTSSVFAHQCPRFENYPVTDIYDGPVAQPQLITHDARRFRALLRQAARRKPDFAGHYIVTRLPCGSHCADIVLLDAITGEVIWYGDGTGCPDAACKDVVGYRLDSNLIVFRGRRDLIEPDVAYYYSFKGAYTQIDAALWPPGNDCDLN